ncbi:hypothetical protein M3I54_19760 [Paraburkholderia sp. CNPSo 3274]|uniref:hypothetical protein n=1 Tax=Paraburkholderia sp. CNPSo 3274 TaxID=2940932 RepID=UPI0020B85E6F|nr:hypothetical protein [Paraburkholderia sp. CNPSo 3274]MCP3709203.1 hypothetical protein [Paraburkholderia sp. CNPSo 3274]
MNSTAKLWVLAFCRFSIVLVTLLICTANITNSALLTWGFHEDQNSANYQITFYEMMNGTARKPFVYRSSFPRGVKWAVSRLGPDLQEKLYTQVKKHDAIRRLYFNRLPDKYWTPIVAVTYYVTYFTVVAAMFLSLWLIYRLARAHALKFGQALGFVVAFSLIYPLTFQESAFYYDFLELLGLFAACSFLLRRQMLACTICIALASFNKETFFLAPLALVFLHERDVSLRARVGWLGLQLACCLASRHLITTGYDANIGSAVEFHLFDNVRFWINPKSYLIFWNVISKGVPTPSVQNPLIIVPLIVYFLAAWRMAGTRYRHYLHAALWPLVALFIPFGYFDEVRALSLAFPALTLIALHGANRFTDIFSSATEPVKMAGDSPLVSATLPDAQRET